jgi:hypothetical protein
VRDKVSHPYKTTHKIFFSKMVPEVKRMNLKMETNARTKNKVLGGVLILVAGKGQELNP